MRKLLALIIMLATLGAVMAQEEPVFDADAWKAGQQAVREKCETDQTYTLEQHLQEYTALAEETNLKIESLDVKQKKWEADYLWWHLRFSIDRNADLQRALALYKDVNQIYMITYCYRALGDHQRAVEYTLKLAENGGKNKIGALQRALLWSRQNSVELDKDQILDIYMSILVTTEDPAVATETFAELRNYCVVDSVPQGDYDPQIFYNLTRKLHPLFVVRKQAETSVEKQSKWAVLAEAAKELKEILNSELLNQPNTAE